MPFPTTQWNLLEVMRDADDKESRRAALGEVISLYGRPLIAFARRQSHGSATVEDCEDLVNSFFVKCMETEALRSADQARGKFRNFLAKSFKYFMLNEDRAERAIKKSPPAGFVSLEALTDEHGPSLEPRTTETPEEAFERVLRCSLFARLLSEFEDRCRKAGQEKKYQLFALRDLAPRRDGTPVPTYAALAESMDLASENAANKILLAARKEFRELLLAEVGRDCASEREAERECELVVEMALKG